MGRVGQNIVCWCILCASLIDVCAVQMVKSWLGYQPKHGDLIMLRKIVYNMDWEIALLC